jgi:hypothetical protein
VQADCEIETMRVASNPRLTKTSAHVSDSHPWLLFCRRNGARSAIRFAADGTLATPALLTLLCTRNDSHPSDKAYTGFVNLVFAASGMSGSWSESEQRGRRFAGYVCAEAIRTANGLFQRVRPTAYLKKLSGHREAHGGSHDPPIWRCHHCNLRGPVDSAYNQDFSMRLSNQPERSGSCPNS